MRGMKYPATLFWQVQKCIFFSRELPYLLLFKSIVVHCKEAGTREGGSTLFILFLGPGVNLGHVLMVMHYIPRDAESLWMELGCLKLWKAKSKWAGLQSLKSDSLHPVLTYLKDNQNCIQNTCHSLLISILIMFSELHFFCCFFYAGTLMLSFPEISEMQKGENLNANFNPISMSVKLTNQAVHILVALCHVSFSLC